MLQQWAAADTAFKHLLWFRMEELLFTLILMCCGEAREAEGALG
jgi:hypothetical protein